MRSELDDLIEMLDAAGVEVEHRAMYRSGPLPGLERRPVPRRVNLAALRPDVWEVAIAIVWPMLPEGDPHASAVNAARERYDGESAFRDELDAVYRRRDGRATRGCEQPATGAEATA